MPLTTADTVLTLMGSSYAAASAADKAIADFVVPQAINLVKDEVGYEIELTTFTEYQPEQGLPIDDDQLIYGWETIGGKAVPYDYRMQRARAIMQLRNLPLRKVTSVYEAPSAWDQYPPDWPGGTLLTEGQHFRVDYENESFPGVDASYPRLCWTGFLMRRIGVWSPVSRCVKVIYVAGYTDTELAGRYCVFVKAAVDASIWMFKEYKLNALKGGSTGIEIERDIDNYKRKFLPPGQVSRLGLQYALPGSVKTMLEPYVRLGKYRAS